MKNCNRKERLLKFVDSLKSRKVYRAKELQKYSSNLSRDLKDLVDHGLLGYVGYGLYYRIEKLGELELPPEEESLLSKFLNSKDYVLRTIGDFNSLRLGTTQHTPGLTMVYNSKKSGVFELGKRTYHFKRRKFPNKNLNEFLLVDMLNNLEKVGVDREEFLTNLRRRWIDLTLDKNEVLKQAQKYGKYWVKKYFEGIGEMYAISA